MWDFFVTRLQGGGRKLHRTSCSKCSVKLGLSSVSYEYAAHFSEAHYNAICFNCWPKSDFDRLQLEAHLGIQQSDSSTDGSSEEDETGDTYVYTGKVWG